MRWYEKGNTHGLPKDTPLRSFGETQRRRDWGEGACQYCSAPFPKRAPNAKTCPGCTDRTHGMKRL